MGDEPKTKLTKRNNLVGFRPPMEMKMGATAVEGVLIWKRAGEDGRIG